MCIEQSSDFADLRVGQVAYLVTSGQHVFQTPGLRHMKLP